MANRTFNQFQGTLQKGVVTLYAKLVSNGADPTVALGDLKVVTSEVINPSTSPVTINPSSGFVGATLSPTGGQYTISLQDPYVRLLNVAITEVVQTSGTPVGYGAVVITDSVNSQTAPSLVIQFDPSNVSADTNTILLSVTLANSTAL